MSADIIKEAVYDDRIIQSRPKFAVNKGALSLSNAPFSALSQTSTQHTYQVYAPSENVFVDRATELTTTFFIRADAISQGAAVPLNQAVRVIGKDLALAAFPFNSMLSTLQATINDTTVTVNSEDVLKELLRLTDYAENRVQRTCPTMLDNYLRYADGNGAINTPLGSFASSTGHDYVPNGAYPYIEFTKADGSPIAPVGADTYPSAFGPGNINCVNGVPVGDGVRTQFDLYFKVRTTEKLVMSPFVFADQYEWSTGLFGINNISLVMNIKGPQRVLRNDPTATAGGFPSVLLSAPVFNSNVSQGVFQNSVLNVQFLTPSLSVDLPPKSVIPYMEYPRYISPTGSALAPGAVSQVISQTITLPQIPDMLIVYVRAQRVTGQPDPYATEYADAYLPIATGFDGIRAPLSVNFDNFSGLLSSHTTEELYAMCIHNGLEQSWEEWVGRGQKAGSNVAGGFALGGRVGLTGGPLVLKMGQDITLQEGQAASLVGNFTLQLSLQVRNGYDITVAPQMVVITVNSGFLETIRGSSRVIKGVLSEQDIISAPMAAAGTRAEMSRLVGSGFMSSLSNALMKAKDIYSKTKPAVSALRGALPEGQAKSVLGSLGYGMGAGMGMAGCGIGAARRGSKKAGLEARLM
jgi:hypothetical protein